LNEQAQTRHRAQIVLIAKARNGDAFDQFHHKIRTAGLSRTRVEDLGDVGMVHQCQRLSFRFEPGDDFLGIHAQFDDLERDAATHGFLLFGHVNNPTTAFADLLQQFVAANHGAGHFLNRGHNDGGTQSFRRRFFHEGAFLKIGQQGFHSRPSRRVPAAGPVQKGGAFRRGNLVQRLKKNLFIGAVLKFWFAHIMSCHLVMA